jgi:hypothetical protein
MTSDFEVEIQT